MKNILLIGCFSVLVPLGGCIMSESGGGRESNPQPTYTQQMQNSQKNATPVDEKQSSPPNFRTKQDTVKASLILSPKSSVTDSATNGQPPHSLFTIQIGAYTDAANALRTQRLAKARFENEPVFNEFDEKAQLYRVSVGRFVRKEEAEKFLRTIQKTFPREYGKCWIKELSL